MLEAGSGDAQKGQTALCPTPACALCGHALLQGQARRNTGGTARRELHEQGQFPGWGCDPDLWGSGTGAALQWETGETWLVPGIGQAVPQCGCERLIQHFAQSISRRLWQGSRGCCSAARTAYRPNGRSFVMISRYCTGIRSMTCPTRLQNCFNAFVDRM